MVKRWLNRDPSDASGLTFVEWDPVRQGGSADPDVPPVAMIVNSSEVCGAGLKLTELMPPQLDSSVRAVSSRLRSAGVLTVEGMGEI